MKIFIYIFFSLIFFIPSKSIESYISFKVNNEIITNIDLDTEYRYLIALNNELKKTNKKTLLRLAKESIIKEKIKKNEIQKFYKFKQSEDLLNSIIENYYKKLGMENFNDFKNYLNENNLDLEVVKNSCRTSEISVFVTGSFGVAGLAIIKRVPQSILECCCR